MKNYFYLSESKDGWMNLAIDEYFLNHLEPDSFMMYLYINSNAVIIGRNQNAWRECNIKHMDLDGVQLVRRISGGGAVYHDLGNLNFSFITNKEIYDEEKQFGLIKNAMSKLGFQVEFTGRNDLTIDQKKFSGNAFCAKGERRLHHGTILISTNMTKLSGYLNVPEQKLISKGIQSVKSRVCNLTDFVPGLDLAEVICSLKDAYRECYGAFEEYRLNNNESEDISKLYEKHSSWSWRMGETFPFDYETETRFPWGGVQICMKVTGGINMEIKVYTDSLNTEISSHIEDVLTGCSFHSAEIYKKLINEAVNSQETDVAEHILSLGF